MYVEEVSTYTDQANAYAAGFGPTRRVVLWDTLLLDFEENEVKVVVAHEIGHHSSNHILEDGVVRVAGDSRRVHRRAGDAPPRWDEEPGGRAARVADGCRLEPARASPDELGQPAMETEADWKALQSSEHPAAMQSLFKGFAENRSATRHRRGGPRAARYAPDARAARGDGKGLEAIAAVGRRGRRAPCEAGYSLRV